MSMPNPTLQAGQDLDGFRVQRVTALPNLRAQAYELEHLASGARLLHVHANDSENLFCIGFKTPPRDDTGLPHILEHSVLGGSKKYPVRDPFVEMVKMSMATFINAMTYSDKTVYPVASNVRQDFFNLAEVYWDAVFHPTITENTFKQEGHHLALAKRGDLNSPLIVKGIVYNEMKGAYSSADEWVDRVSFQSLYPDTAYGKDSGGDPEHIPELTYTDFKKFYEELYHPGNSYIFIFGDIPTKDHLSFLKDKLGVYTKREIHTEIKRQPRWNVAHERVEAYPIGKGDSTDNKTYFTMNWIVGDATAPAETLAMSALDLLLLGHAGAPLRKALVDSQLGEDLTDSGFSPGRLESSFHIGLKGTSAERKSQIENIIINTLKQIAKAGFSKEMVDAAFHQLAYRNLEIKSMFPLWLMDRAYATWIYGGDPLIYLRADEWLTDLEKRYQANPRLFSELIEQRLLNNTHRSLLTFAPDPDLITKKEAAFAEKMKSLKASMKKEQLEALEKSSAELEKIQNTPNSAEALASLPQLKVSDLPKKPQEVPTSSEKVAEDAQGTRGVELLRTDVFANGVSYLQLDVNLSGLPADLYAYLPLYSDCFGKMGAAGLDFVKTAERVISTTGGAQIYTSTNYHVGQPQKWVRRARYSLKFLDGKATEALSTFRDLMYELDFKDNARLKDVLTQAKASHRSALVSSGMSMAIRHASRGINAEGNLAEIMGGLPQTRLIETLADNFDAKCAEVVSKLEAIRTFFRTRGHIAACFTGSDAAYAKTKGALEKLCNEAKPEKLPDNTPAFTPWPAGKMGPVEGLAVPAEVAYCALACPAPHLSHPDSSLLTVASRLLSLGYLWEEVRVKGGAYGGGCGYNGLEGTWEFHSYRDPWIKQTLDTFNGLRKHVENATWSQTDIDRAIIGTAKHAERPIRPGQATGTALWRHVNGDTPEMRMKRHEGYLKVTPKELKRAVLELLDTNMPQAAFCVVSNREKIEEAGKQISGLTVEDVMK